MQALTAGATSPTLNLVQLQQIDAYWRAANYLALDMI